MARDRATDQHRTLTEQELGRTLGPNEVVDHVNEDKEDNSKANRRVMERGAHTAHHNQRRSTGKLVAALNMVRDRKKMY